MIVTGNDDWPPAGSQLIIQTYAACRKFPGLVRVPVTGAPELM